ncbi:MAG: minor capsid protein [Trueperaceae bacterium]|nr:minor capsid protein [Trueperaceae bacterium]
MSVLLDLANRIHDEGVATLWSDLTVGRMPDTPDEIVTLQTYAGDASRIRNDMNLPADERFNVQVLVRAEPDNQYAAETLAAEVYDAVQFRNQTLDSGQRYAYARAVQQPAFLTIDENDRPLVAFNLEVRRHRDTFS